VRYLASDQLGGRITGSPGADSAAAYIARRFAQAGLQPSSQGWFQPFEVSRDAPAVAQLRLGALNGRNVIGVLPGKDPVLRNEIVIVGAPLRSPRTGRAGQRRAGSGRPEPGAQRRRRQRVRRRLRSSILRPGSRPIRPGRTVVFIAFSGEELGLLGSAYYVKHPLYPLAGTEAMVNLDMVGRLRNKRLIVYGSRDGEGIPRPAGFAQLVRRL
jgi:hypothetical protein